MRTIEKRIRMRPPRISACMNTHANSIFTCTHTNTVGSHDWRRDGWQRETAQEVRLASVRVWSHYGAVYSSGMASILLLKRLFVSIQCTDILWMFVVQPNLDSRLLVCHKVFARVWLHAYTVSLIRWFVYTNTHFFLGDSPGDIANTRLQDREWFCQWRAAETPLKPGQSNAQLHD